MLGDIDPSEYLRIVLKVRAEGLASLDEEERATYDRGLDAFRPIAEHLTRWFNESGARRSFEILSEHIKGQLTPDHELGFALWEQLSEDERERYADWTPLQVLALFWAQIGVSDVVDDPSE